MKFNPRVAGLVIAAVLLSVVAWMLTRPRLDDGSLMASGTVEATEARLGFQVPGRIDSVLVREGQSVRAGQVLAVLDRREVAARREQARALLAELERGSRPEEIAQAAATVEVARQRLEDARRDLERAHTLFAGGAVSQEAVDKSQMAYDVARSQLAQAEEQHRLVKSGPRRERIEAQRAQLAQVEAVLDNMAIRAPFDGVVTVRHREPGETAGAGAPVLSVLDRSSRWVRIFVREDRVGAVRMGLPATITSDTYRDRTYIGEVVFIASEAEFTPKNVQTTEERVKLVYAVKVRIEGDEAFELKPGMPADVRLALE